MKCNYCERDVSHPCRNTRDMDPHDGANNDAICNATLSNLGGGERNYVSPAPAITTKYDEAKKTLQSNQKTWAITGVAGFIGSNLLEALLKLNQRVVGLDNFATGYQRNLDEVQSLVTSEQWSRFRFIKGDIGDLDACRMVCAGADYVLHEAAIGSVPRSIEDPIYTNASNVTGFLNMLVAADKESVSRFIYAASSSTYGDHPGLPKVENAIGRPLSPYAVTKYVNELYAEVFARCYDMETIGLRYFNVFGPRQDPEGAYAAVIPKWAADMIKGKTVFINGDGATSRDFTFIDNIVQLNILAATSTNPGAINHVYNAAVGDISTLNTLYDELKRLLSAQFEHLTSATPVYRDFRAGDVQHSLADISKAKRLLGYEPSHRINQGLEIAMPWYVRQNAQKESNLV